MVLMDGDEMGDENDSSVNLDSLRANWNPSQDKYFLELLLSQLQLGNRISKVISKQAWPVMVEQFNSKFGLKYDIDALKNRHKRFRKQYNDVKMIIGQNGFRWDHELNMIIADDKTWDEYLKVHPDFQGFRKRVVPYYDDLCKIFGHSVADGRYSLSCFDVGFENEEIASKELDDQATAGKGDDDETVPIICSQSKIDWSPMMDQFFVELMLNQMHKGNKVGRSFKKKAWVDMTDSFNERFGCHCGKAVLKNRLIVLRRHYFSINVLLSKEGFSWDNAHQKVVADDQVWENCIRVHHNYRIYRTKSMPFYSSMCILCHNEDTQHCKLNSGEGSCGSKKSMPDTEPPPIADDTVLHIGAENNSTRKSQPLPDADKEPLHLGEGRKISGHQKRLQPNMSSNEYKKARNDGEGMVAALKHMAVAVTSLTKQTKIEDTFSIDKAIKVLQAIPGMDEDLILDACEFLEDERRARMFMALDDNLRKKWLLRKLRS
ncbi:L10-interacting MYB domain-containing protein isoform X1 [Arachis ipaensis]|nr:L10-interacting MYB domain-containing protein isoform X1 [Arachis ipaensis]XP_025634767.1 L10-interacting MYB domain-containing protein isoform X1 [Arachis hypogaea]